MYNYHDPVLLNPSVDALVTNPDGTYVDVTFGGGGHSRAILNKLSPKGKLIAFDQDEDAKQNLPNDDRLTFVNHNFCFIQEFLDFIKATPVDGILADLGISSHQIDVEDRGFAHRLNGPLDMRMSQSATTTAADLLNNSTQQQLTYIFQQYGEVQNTHKLVNQILQIRKSQSFSSINLFKEQIKNCIPQATQAKYLSQVFQALRIAVNKEMEVLETFLKATEYVIKPEGRLVVIAYHSLEDRMVKHLFQTGNLEGKRHTDLYGGISKPFDPQPNKAIAPDEEEIARNKRARSAKMRIGVRNTWNRTQAI